MHKARAHAGQTAWLFHYREPRGAEVDLVVENARALVLVEAKSGATVANDFFAGLDAMATLLARVDPARAVERILVYGGDHGYQSRGVTVVPWNRIQDGRWLDPAAIHGPTGRA